MLFFAIVLTVTFYFTFCVSLEFFPFWGSKLPESAKPSMESQVYTETAPCNPVLGEALLLQSGNYSLAQESYWERAIRPTVRSMKKVKPKLKLKTKAKMPLVDMQG